MSHVSAYSVVGDAPRRVIFGSVGSEIPEPIQLKLGMFDYVYRLTQHANYSLYGGRRGVRCAGEMGEVVPSRAFFLFLVPSTHEQQSLRSTEATHLRMFVKSNETPAA